ncbi:MAG: flagellar motor switch protein FliN [Pseudomonadota bacterium]
MSEENTNDEAGENAVGEEASSADETGADNGAQTQDEASGDSYEPDELDAAEPTPAGADINLDVVLDVPVNVALRVGQASISIRQLVSLVEGSVIELDRESTDPMDVLVNDTLVARGEIVVVDEKFGVRLTDVVSPNERISTLN